METVRQAPVPLIREEPVPAVPVPAPGIGGPAPVLVAPEHIPVGETTTYNTIPPTSGHHWPATAQCGIHDDEQPDELVLHNLEHGQVVISYDLEDPSEKSKLVRLVQRLIDFGRWGVLRTYSRIEPGTVALTAWGVLDVAAGVDADRIERLYDAYKRNVLSGEGQLRGPIPCP